MGTKSKNSFIYSIVFSLAILLLGYSTLSMIVYSVYSEQLKEDSYFKTEEFLYRLQGSIVDLQDYYVTYDFVDYEKKTEDEKITKEELDNAVKLHNEGIEQGIKGITDEYAARFFIEGELSEEQYLAQRDKEIKEFEERNRKSVEEIKKELISNKNELYQLLKSNVSKWKSLKYYLINNSTGEVYTNLSGNVDFDQYLKQEMIYYDKYPKQELSMNMIEDQISIMLSEKNVEGHFFIPKEGTGYSEFYLSNLEFANRNNRIITEAKIGAVAFFLSIILFIIVSRRDRDEKTVLGNLTNAYVRIPIEIRITFFGGAVGLCAEAFSIVKELPTAPYWAYGLYCVCWSLFLLFMLLHIRGLYHLIVNSEYLKSQWRGSIIGRVFTLFVNIFNNRKTIFKVLIMLLASMFIGFAVIGILASGDGFVSLLCLIYIVGYLWFVYYFVYKRVIYFNDVVKGSNSIATGNFDLVIEEKGNDQIRVLAQNFNNIKNGYKSSMEDQIKSERLKTELITNVSHDLKTPLTSIINYVDLLKNKELSEEEKDSYIEILDRKSQRLKILIEDLFEASKMSSGSVELEREQVDIAAILRQTLGELDEKINKSSLTFRANIPGEKIYLYLDGKKTWRVFENLINNAIKYSQPNTRVYIDLLESESSVVLTIKNVANYEMDFDPEEIFERFKRGDKSRNTEGSGLGLAIARSIVELQGGKMNIEIDGDLFKVIVEFKKTKLLNTQGGF